MSRKLARQFTRDPDALVFWLITTLCALFGLFDPGVTSSL